MVFLKKIKAKYNFDTIDFFLILSPFVDLLIRFLIDNYNISIVGNIFRGGIVFGLLIYIFFVKKNKNSKLLLYICLLLIYVIIFLINQYIISPDGIKYEIIGIIKYMFYPLVLSSLIDINNNKKKYNILFISAVLYSFLLIIPFILGNSVSTYTGLKSGYIGWFYSPNEISTIIGILSPFVFLKVFKSNYSFKKILYLIISLLYIYCAFSIGTKTPIFSIMISVLMSSIFVIYNFVFSTKSTKYKKNILFIVLMIACSIIIFINSNTYKNLRVHEDVYKQLEKINEQFIADNGRNDFIENKNNNTNESIESNNSTSNNVMDKVSGEDGYIPVNNIENDNINYIYNLLNKSDSSKNNIYKTNKIINLILSSRDIYFNDTYSRFVSADISEKVFGAGVVQSNEDNNISKAIEIDFLDIFFNYGIIGFTIYFGLIGFILFKVFKKFVLNFKSYMSDDIKFSYYESVIICIFISSFSGHILGAPAVSLFAAVILSDLFCYDNKFKITDNFWTRNNILKIIRYLIIMSALFGISIILGKYFDNDDLVIKDDSDHVTFVNYNSVIMESKTIESSFAKDIIEYYDLKNKDKIIANVIVLNRIVKNEKRIYVTIKSNIDNLHVIIDNINPSNVLYNYNLIANKYNLIFKKIKKDLKTDKKIDVYLAKNEYLDYGDEIFDNYIISGDNIMYKDYSYVLNNLNGYNRLSYCSNVHSLKSYSIKNNDDYMLYDASYKKGKIDVNYYFDENYNNDILNLIEGDFCE